MSIYFLPGYLGTATEFGAVQTITVTSTDHGNLAGLADDDHAQYPERTTAETITGSWTFDLDPAAPFVVTAASAKVANLDADLLDGRDEAAFGALADNETVGGNWTHSGTTKFGSGGVAITALRFAAAAGVADGGTIAHGMGAAPTVAFTQASVAGEFASVTALDATNITVAIKTHAGAAGTAQTIYWLAVR